MVFGNSVEVKQGYLVRLNCAIYASAKRKGAFLFFFDNPPVAIGFLGQQVAQVFFNLGVNKKRDGITRLIK